MSITPPPSDSLYANTPGQVRSDHPATAKAAALSVPTGEARKKVFLAIQMVHAGLTDEEIALVTDLPPNTARPRRVELERSGHIITKGTRKTASGRAARVWVIRSTP